MSPGEYVAIWWLNFFGFFIAFFVSMGLAPEALMYAWYSELAGFVSESRWDDLFVLAAFVVAVLVVSLLVLIFTGLRRLKLWLAQISFFAVVFYAPYLLLPDGWFSPVANLLVSLACTSVLIFIVARVRAMR